jgi:transcription elongation factor Elf1
MAHKKKHKHNFCSRFRGNPKKVIMACRNCSLIMNCKIFLLYVDPYSALDATIHKFKNTNERADKPTQDAESQAGRIRRRQKELRL